MFYHRKNLSGPPGRDRTAPPGRRPTVRVWQSTSHTPYQPMQFQSVEPVAYEKKLADGKKKREDDKDALKRARETEAELREELREEREDRVKFQKMLDFVLDKCRAEGWAYRGPLESEAAIAAAQE